MHVITKLHSNGEDSGRRAARGSGEDPARTHWQALRIVICDDDKDTVNTLAAILEDEGHKVERVYSGQDVLRVVRKVQPHAVICDIAMPKVTGYDVVKAIRRQFVTYRPLVIAISGVYVKPTEALFSQAVGFDHHLTKPVHPDEVIRVLDELAKKPR